jgi:hypothetical protein
MFFHVFNPYFQKLKDFDLQKARANTKHS